MFQLEYKSKQIAAISDTHGNHRKINIAECDILIHCGDACTDGNMEQLEDFFNWFSTQKSKYKIFIAGNHDLIFDLDPNNAVLMIPSNVIFLEDQSVTIGGIHFNSIAARPWLHSNYPAKKCDILLTHGPAFSILDDGLGCQYLKSYLDESQPEYFLFGHIHQQGGKQEIRGESICINLCEK